MSCADVIKSRIQLRDTPPTGTPVQYIAREFKLIVAESGLYVHSYIPHPFHEKKNSNLMNGLPVWGYSAGYRRPVSTFIAHSERISDLPFVVLRR